MLKGLFIMGEFWNNMEKKMKIIIFILGFFTTVLGAFFGTLKYAGFQLDSKINNIVEKKIKDISINYNKNIFIVGFY